MEWILNKKELPKLCEYLDLKNHRGIYLFSGDLASGKTTLIQVMVASLGSKAKATSPTFLTALEYGNQIYHYDIYNKDLEKLFALIVLLRCIASNVCINFPQYNIFFLWIQYE